MSISYLPDLFLGLKDTVVNKANSRLYRVYMGGIGNIQICSMSSTDECYELNWGKGIKSDKPKM